MQALTAISASSGRAERGVAADGDFVRTRSCDDVVHGTDGLSHAGESRCVIRVGVDDGKAALGSLLLVERGVQTVLAGGLARAVGNFSVEVADTDVLGRGVEIAEAEG